MIIALMIFFQSSFFDMKTHDLPDTNEDEEEVDDEYVLAETPLDKITQENTEFNKHVGKTQVDEDTDLKIKDENITVLQEKYSKPKRNRLPLLLDIRSANSDESAFSLSCPKKGSGQGDFFNFSSSKSISTATTDTQYPSSSKKIKQVRFE